MGGQSIGVSVVICCHNSSARLPATLSHLAAQDVPKDLAWEVVVVDNASTDDTAAVAAAHWPAGAPARLRVVSEPRPGLRHARERGLAESCWPLVSFIDDDNWVAPDWVRLVAEIMTANPRLGACGGFSEAVCEVPPPAWFETYAHCYAVGPQGDPTRDHAGLRIRLWGAGLNLRREALDRLARQGFEPVSMGRQGKRLSAGEDSELCHALRLAGWDLGYDPRLRLKHFLPASRLQWRYLRRLVRGFGATLLDPYWFEVDPRLRALPAWKKTWAVLALRDLRVVPRWLPGLFLNLLGLGEGNARCLGAERALGRWGALWSALGVFGLRCRAVRQAAWRAPTPPSDPGSGSGLEPE
ncbi:MAG: glycosyltransferase [Verrucomicrobiales bacterium]|nr:glycosyltransferase [Verrucomicrobiales bacterium]